MHAEMTRAGGTARTACMVEFELLNVQCQAWDSVIAPWPIRASAELRRATPPGSSFSANLPASSTALVLYEPIPDTCSHAATAQNIPSTSEQLPLTCMHDMHASVPDAGHWEVSMHVTGEQLLDVTVSDATAHVVHALSGLVEYAATLVSAAAQGEHIQTPTPCDALHLVATGAHSTQPSQFGTPPLPPCLNSCTVLCSGRLRQLLDRQDHLAATCILFYQTIA